MAHVKALVGGVHVANDWARSKMEAQPDRERETEDRLRAKTSSRYNSHVSAPAAAGGGGGAAHLNAKTS